MWQSHSELSVLKVGFTILKIFQVVLEFWVNYCLSYIPTPNKKIATKCEETQKLP